MRRLNPTLSRLEFSPVTAEALAVDLGDVKLQRRVTSNSLDALFEMWTRAATMLFEEQTGRQVISRLWEYALDGVPTCAELEIPKPPLHSVASVTYMDADGAEQTLDAEAYSVVAPVGPYATPGRIVLASGAAWPTVLDHPRALRITFTAGYGDTASDVPALVKQCLLFLIGHFHKYGEEVQEASLSQLPIGAEAMMRAFKYSALPTRVPWGV